ncbi:hypothetical protein ACJMK2_011437 [Sinanodonta woodiana]|uniref:Chitin-binding type-2 domain-containing protein n=1 Tax=Sinanodonta woodiana TaxID=1069815 RepID=A0ABD3V506_SINWO
MLLIVVLFVLPWSGLALDCSMLPDGDYEIGCKIYATCTSHVLQIHKCVEGTVYNRNTHQCDDPRTVPPPCNESDHCAGLSDGLYPIANMNCTSYYTCVDHTMQGINFCAPGTVFNQFLQTCDWSDHVAPPCGTGH